MGRLQGIGKKSNKCVLTLRKRNRKCIYVEHISLLYFKRRAFDVDVRYLPVCDEMTTKRKKLLT